MLALLERLIRKTKEKALILKQNIVPSPIQRNTAGPGVKQWERKIRGKISTCTFPG